MSIETDVPVEASSASFPHHHRVRQPAGAAFRHVRPMQPEDVPAIAGLFFKVFRRNQKSPNTDFEAYFREAFFECPYYGEEHGGIVHVDASGQIDSAIAVIPMRMMACDRIEIGRLMCAFMADPDARSGGAAKLALTVRARHQSFCFSDTASPVSADHVRAVGGIVLPIQSLEWRTLFRPVRHFAGWLERKAPVLALLHLKALARPFDALVRRRPSRSTPQRPNAGEVYDLSDEDFFELAPAMVERFAVRPVWSAPELRWLLKMARLNTSAGPLHLNAVVDPDGAVIGCFVFYGEKGKEAKVLNILTRSGAEQAVVSAMMQHLDDMGCVTASGMAQPFLLDAFDQQRGYIYRLRSYFWVSTRHADIREAILHDDFYSGGLAGETWSRLISDFS